MKTIEQHKVTTLKRKHARRTHGPKMETIEQHKVTTLKQKNGNNRTAQCHHTKTKTC